MQLAYTPRKEQRTIVANERLSTDSQVDFILSASDETDDTDVECTKNQPDEAQHVDNEPVGQEVNAVNNAQLLLRVSQQGCAKCT